MSKHISSPKDVARVREWQRNNAEKRRQYIIIWNEKNKEKIKLYKAAYRLKNADRMKDLPSSKFRKSKHSTQGIINGRMGTAIRICLKGRKNGRAWESLVGFSALQLMKHLERRFLPGMSWDNMGEWHIDHIIPLSAFHYESTEDIDFKKCWSLNNLQPLWGNENLTKGDRLEKPFQPSLAMVL